MMASRGAVAALVLAMAVVINACGGGSRANFPEDERRSSNAYYEEPDVYRQLLRDPWVRGIPLGGSTFGREVPKLVRLRIDGSGAMLDRDVRLHTPATVTLFSGPGEQRMKQLLHGMLELLDERDGLVSGIAIARTPQGYRAAAISPIIEENVIDGVLTADDRRFVQRLLGEIAREQARHTYAWFSPGTTWMAVGVQLGTTIHQHATRPRAVTPAKGIFTAYVLRHEIEHAITAAEVDGNEHVRWIEEGGADVLAMWPGEAARTATLLGLPYPKRFERRRYDPGRSAYGDWSASLLLLLRAAGVDYTRPEAFEQASELLQTGEPHDVPGLLAEAIATEQGLPEARRAHLERAIERLDGRASATRRLVAGWL